MLPLSPECLVRGGRLPWAVLGGLEYCPLASIREDRNAGILKLPVDAGQSTSHVLIGFLAVVSGSDQLLSIIPRNVDVFILHDLDGPAIPLPWIIILIKGSDGLIAIKYQRSNDALSEHLAS